MLTRIANLAILAAVLCTTGTAWGQYSQITSPFNTANNSFFERQGVGFNFGLRTGGNLVGIGRDGQPTPNGDIIFNQGGSGTALPPFGGFDNNAGGQAGFAINNGAGTFGFNFDFAQGNSRSLVNQTPTIVIPNGGTGFVSDSTVRPFVISLIPVVGQGGAIGNPYMIAHPYDNVPFSGAPQQYFAPSGPSHVQRFLGDAQAMQSLRNSTARSELDRAVEALPPPRAPDPIVRDLAIAAGGKSQASTASRPAASVAEIQAQHAAKNAAGQQEAARHLAEGRRAESEGKTGVARIYYQRGLKRATGELRKQLQTRLDDLASPSRR
jgi:hypothetical protein